MAVQLQALHIALYGPSFKLETCHRKLNISLIRDAMRAVVDKDEYTTFVNDLREESNDPGGIDGLRCVALHCFDI